MTTKEKVAPKGAKKSRKPEKKKGGRFIFDCNERFGGDGTLPVIDYDKFQSTLSDDEFDRICKKIDEYEKSGNEDEYDKWMAKFPIAPHIALFMLLDPFEPEGILDYYNLDDAEACFGKDWIEKYKPKAPPKIARPLDEGNEGTSRS